MKHTLLRTSLALTLCLAGCVGQDPDAADETGNAASQIGTPGALNSTLLGRYDFAADQNTREFAIAGNYAYVTRRGDGFAVVDISNRQSPALVTTVNPAPGAMDAVDAAVLDIGGTNYLFIANNSGVVDPGLGNFTGVYVYSLATPSAPAFVSALTWGAGGGYHLAGQVYTLTAATIGGRAFLFAGSRISSSIEVFDFTNPAAPTYFDEIIRHHVNSFATICGLHVQGGKLYAAWQVGFAVYDLTGFEALVPNYYNPPQPPRIVTHRYTGASTHTAVPNATGEYVLTTDNVSSGRVRVWDVRVPTAVTQVAAFGGSSGAIARQVAVQGDLAWVTHYQDGLRVFDIANPAAPVSLAWYDTDANPLANQRVGGWDVIPDGNGAWFTDSADGILAVNIQDTLTITTAHWYKYSKRLVVNVTSTLQPRPTLTVTGVGAMTWSATNNRYELNVPANTNPGTITVTSSYGADRSATVLRRNL